jgi:hypothetical protein
MIDKIQVITNYHARDLVSGGGVMAEKVWVVTDGEYSGYHIIGAFSTEAKADEFVSLFGGRVEEWDLDPFQKAVRRGVRAWSVRMDEDGDRITHGPTFTDAHSAITTAFGVASTPRPRSRPSRSRTTSAAC